MARNARVVRRMAVAVATKKIGSNLSGVRFPTKRSRAERVKDAVMIVVRLAI